MNDSGPNKSLKEFDYFSEQVAPQAPQPGTPLAEAAEEARATHRQEIRRHVVRVAVAIVALAVSLSLLLSFRDPMLYAFSPAREPLQLGEVETLRPEEIRHNSYVELTGITEHRGMGIKEVRNLSLNRQEYWYFRLLGSRGVFLSVPPDSSKYGIVTKLTVRGRAVDPSREACCQTLLDEYRARFNPRESGQLRVIQVDTLPGEGRLPYLGVLLLNALLTASLLFAARRLIATIRRQPQLRVPTAKG